MPQEPKFIQVSVSTVIVAGGSVRKTIVALDANGDVWEYTEATTTEHWFKLSPTRQQ